MQDIISRYLLKLQIPKFSFPQYDTSVLGDVIAKDGVKVDEFKVEKMQQLNKPNSTAMRGFLGLSVFYCRFLRVFSYIAAPRNAATSMKKKVN